MAAAPATAATEASSRSSVDGGRGSSSTDSYIGSLISLTSKCEIRYEGVLYNINTEESSIGLRNVRSFGTEGRKKDGPQILPSDKIYEYILFRGSDIKDLQVKSSPPVQAMSAVHNDPAIIQSHYPQPTSVSASLPSAGSGTVADLSLHTSQLGVPRPTFQGGLPLYQTGGSLGSWGSPPAPPNANGPGLQMPMYWQGFYRPSSGLPQMHQQSLLRPPPGLPMLHSMQLPMQYPTMNASMPTGALNMTELPPPMLPPVISTLNLTSAALPSTLAPSEPAALASETSLSLISNSIPITSLPATIPSSNSPLVPPLTAANFGINSVAAPVSSKPQTVPVGPILSSETVSQSMSSVVGPSISSHSDTVVPSLVTPNQLLQAGPSVLPTSQPLPKSKNVEASPPISSEQSASSSTDILAPLLPLPTQSDLKISRAATKFAEDFDFMAMNEKFKKDEVWGYLGRSKGQSKETEGELRDHKPDDTLSRGDAESSKLDTKPVYVKDDFFDSLSCNALDRGSRDGRTKFSEQIKIDTETFGDFPRHRGRGGRGPGWGPRGRSGSYYGRGYVGRGRGQTMSSRN